MAVDYIRYDILTQDAMRGVVRTVLSDAATKGLPGEHHFYISFDTRNPAVKLSPRLRAQYPEEMTIVLQHQFWDLTVTDTGFEVGLSFNGIPERLGIPFDAIKGFADPSVKFGLQFAEIAGAGETAAEPQAPAPATAESAAPKSEALPQPTAPPADGPDKPQGADVVRLDRFRKK